MSDKQISTFSPEISTGEKIRQQLEILRKENELKDGKQERAIMKALIEGESVVSIADRYKISPVKISRLMKSALKVSKEALKMSQEELLHLELLKMSKAEQIVHNALEEIDIAPSFNQDGEEYVQPSISAKDKIAAALALMKISQYRTKDLLGLKPLSEQNTEDASEEVNQTTSSVVKHLSSAEN